MYYQYEHRSKPLLSRQKFYVRLAAHGILALGAIALSLVIGVCGYHFLADLPWIDALLNASMILGGMGPVDETVTTSAKVFASLYALYSGLVLLACLGILFAPILHRILHSFHLEKKKDDDV